MKHRFLRCFHLTSMLLVLLLHVGCSTAGVDVRIQCDKPTVALSEDLYGIFFEDINFAADGGLYAELVQNRSFEYYPVPGSNPLSEQYHPLYAWDKVERGGASVSMSQERLIPLNRNNPFYLTLRIQDVGQGAGVMNSGYDGIRLDAGESYDISLYARSEGRGRERGRGGVSITVALELEDGTVCGSTSFERIGNAWTKFEGVIKSDKTTDNARLVLTTTQRTTLHLDMVSLFPQKTFKGRKNGMRADLAQALADLEPKFFRFPGGCIAHGQGLANVYNWKDSVGDVAERHGNWNRWGYHQTYGLGYFEYFQLCEDIGAAPLPVVPVGVSCGFTAPYEVCPMEELDVWIDDALDLIEFANGPVDSRWGKVRAKMGHPESFGLEYICLGNEEHDRPELRERFPHFVTAIRAKYPDIKIIGTSGLSENIPIYDLMTELDVYSSDEHYYMSPEWFIQNQDRFDDFDRAKPKIFVGEYASHSQGNTLYDAVAEAAFLTGVERNGDIVDMTCYAPLFAHYDHTQWAQADLIWFDKRQVVKTPNYYVQQLFSRNTGDVYLKNSITKQKDTQPVILTGTVGVGTWVTAIEVEKAEVNGQALDLSTLKGTSGNFSIQDGLYVQSDTRAQPAISLAKSQYNDDTVTYTVRARKTEGDEGFLVVFAGTDERNYYWWNVGGWGNTQHALEQTTNGAKATLVQARGSIRDNTWYDLKVELSPGKIRCFLNDELIHDYTIETPTLSVASTLDKAANEVIVKLVNPTHDDIATTIHLEGVTVDPQAELKVIAGTALAKNTREQPELVKTVTKPIKVGKTFNYTAPAMSVQFIRVKVK